MYKDRIILPSYDPPFDDNGAFSQDKPEENKCPKCLELESECRCAEFDAEEDVFKTLGDILRPEKPKPINPLMSFVNKLNRSF